MDWTSANFTMLDSCASRKNCGPGIAERNREYPCKCCVPKLAGAGALVGPRQGSVVIGESRQDIGGANVPAVYWCLLSGGKEANLTLQFSSRWSVRHYLVSGVFKSNIFFRLPTQLRTVLYRYSKMIIYTLPPPNFFPSPFPKFQQCNREEKVTIGIQSKYLPNVSNAACPFQSKNASPVSPCSMHCDSHRSEQ